MTQRVSHQQEIQRNRRVAQQFMRGFAAAGSVILVGTWLFSRIAGFEVDITGGLISIAVALGAFHLVTKQRDRRNTEPAE